MSEPHVRIAEPQDARAIADVHVRAWQAAYRGHMPDSFLESLSPEQRADWWRRTLEGPRDPQVWVVERDGAIVGIAIAGRPQFDREERPQGSGELWMINLVPEAWGTGAAGALFLTAVDHLRACGYTGATLWVLDANERARRFYEREGWYADGATKLDDRGTFALNEVRYRVDF